MSDAATDAPDGADGRGPRRVGRPAADGEPSTLALRDGTTVVVRPIRPDDRQRLLAMWQRTSPESRRRRFQGYVTIDESNVDRFTDIDPAVEFALVATLGRGEDERLVGVGRYVLDDAREDAEFSLLVEDAHQDRGIGTGLLRRLALRLRDEGVETLSSEVLSENSPMLRIIEDLGLRRVGRDRDMGVVHTDLAVDLGDDFLRVGDEADRGAAVAAVQRFLTPASIAVVGASRDRRSIGGLVFGHLLASGFDGPVMPVNSDADHVQGVAAYRRLADCPTVPELVVVAVPAARVAGVVDEAGRLGVRAVAVISAGFAEEGEQGAARQRELVEVARGHGLRILGPNCMGVLNGASDARMNASFSATFPAPGGIAMSSQSGALGLAVLDSIDAMGLGISSFVSVGNRADITTNDLLHHWTQDPTTDVVLLYLESFDDPRTFSRTARRLSRRTPVVVVRSGHAPNRRRAGTGRARALADADVASEALFAQTGIIRTDTLQAMFDVALLLEQQPLPQGGRVAIVSNADGPATLAADACATHGLRVPALGERALGALTVALPGPRRPANPLDLATEATPAAYRDAVRALGTDGGFDALLVLHVATGTATPEEVADALAAACADLPDDLTVLSVFASRRGVLPQLAAAGVPSFPFPEDAAAALGAVHAHAQWRSRPLGTVVRPTGIDPDAARSVVADALRAADGTDDEGLWLTHRQAQAVLQSYGVSLATAEVVTAPEGAAAFQRRIDAPVVVKSADPIARTDVGALALDLRTPEEAADAVRQLRAHLAAQGLAEHAERILVQQMVRDGVEMVVGVTDDPTFGPLLVTGMGGTLVELVGDLAVRVTPVTDRDVQEMLEQLRMKPLLDGYRGGPAMDRAALVDLLHRIGALVEDVPEVLELDCNPVFVRPDGRGVVAVDVRIRVGAGRPA